ncbi:MAG TPA: transglutaminase-like cysteine peptidase [Bradyrhizobium sp.]|uniref:transglutaminase-like cysteine peptidase n=1 Tax=Bradyrhizobium sp. TaxID=376 RepID=UPI002B48E89C|nr:transglutaminase-like cysteine peptidase [Bradyrhizobium sp.]HKO69942.1 transglutaminase-like cysteine peptidase [Bradyrhizobium sp.]
MGFFGHSPARRAIGLACALAWYGLAADLSAGTLEQADSPSAPQLSQPSAEPFGLSVSRVFAGRLREKWRNVERKLDDERVQIALCDGDRERCASPAALRFLAIIDSARGREGRARLGEVNRAVNLAIRPMSDQAQYGEADVWTSPLVTFTHGAGDCEDYAIAKFVALHQAGISSDDLRIVIIRDTIRGEDHAVAAARLDGHWLALDNRRMAMVEDDNLRNYRPLFVIDQHGLMQYREPPLLAEIPDGVRSPTLTLTVSQPGLVLATN